MTEFNTGTEVNIRPFDAITLWEDEYRGEDEEGSLDIQGVTYGYWLDRDNVWFYAYDNGTYAEGEDTVARFEIHHNAWRIGT